MTHKCIYCKKEKDASEFNREHVVPRMMGTYENGFVLMIIKYVKNAIHVFQ